MIYCAKINFHVVPVHIHNPAEVNVPLVSVTYIISFLVVVVIALACVAVISGGANPCVVELTSSFADAFGVSVPMPTLLFAP